eukprot:scaffold235915_cov21-Tisochrysis_lutea.AAC.1
MAGAEKAWTDSRRARATTEIMSACARRERVGIDRARAVHACGAARLRGMQRQRGEQRQEAWVGPH